MKPQNGRYRVKVQRASWENLIRKNASSWISSTRCGHILDCFAKAKAEPGKQKQNKQKGYKVEEREMCAFTMLMNGADSLEAVLMLGMLR